MIMKEEQIKDLSVVITGGTTGIGRAAAIELANLGANILIAGSDGNHLNDALTSIQQQGLQGTVHGIVVDLSTENGINQLFNEADEKLARVDVLINNAALAFQGVVDGGYSDWQKVVGT